MTQQWKQIGFQYLFTDLPNEQDLAFLPFPSQLLIKSFSHLHFLSNQLINFFLSFSIKLDSFIFQSKKKY